MSGIKKAKSGEDFRLNAKKYVVNMEKNIKTLHIKCTPKCYPSKFLYTYIDFDKENEVEEYFIKNNKAYRKCEICFPSR